MVSLVTDMLVLLNPKCKSMLSIKRSRNRYSIGHVCQCKALSNSDDWILHKNLFYLFFIMNSPNM